MLMSVAEWTGVGGVGTGGFSHLLVLVCGTRWSPTNRPSSGVNHLIITHWKLFDSICPFLAYYFLILFEESRGILF